MLAGTLGTIGALVSSWQLGQLLLGRRAWSLSSWALDSALVSACVAYAALARSAGSTGLRRSLVMALTAIQVPIIRVPGFDYALYIGAKLSLQFAADGNITVGAGLGNNARFELGKALLDTSGVGVNGLAALTLVLLLREGGRLGAANHAAAAD